MIEPIELKVEERLIVAADFSPIEHGGIQGVKRRVLDLAADLEGLGVFIKINSILRATGYGLIEELHDLGLKVFADLKLIDIPNTMRTDGELLSEVKPDLLTVMCCAGMDGMNAVQECVGEDTKILGVTVLTSINEEDCQLIFGCSTKAGVLKFARMTQLAGLGGLILSPKEVEVITSRFELGLTLNTPGVRPEWFITDKDDQVKARVMTPKKAIMSGADRLVMGRPIIKAKSNDEGLPQSPKEAVERTLEEIREAVTLREKKGD